MTAFNPIPLMKLYNMAKKAKYDGYGHKIVYIDARKKYWTNVKYLDTK
ncbi:DUF1031 family protein [Lactococcus petauri]|nr:DUF1031 family protein [Lactococcus petauri]